MVSLAEELLTKKGPSLKDLQVSSSGTAHTSSAEPWQQAGFWPSNPTTR